MVELNGLQVLDVAGLNLLVAKLKDGTLIVGKAGEVPASGITGTISLDNLPHAALDRLVVVQDDEARLALTKENVQKGDSVKVLSTGKMYAITDDSKLAGEDDGEGGTRTAADESAFTEYSVGRAAVAALAEAVAWANITGKPAAYTPEAHNHAANEVTAMTGYEKAASTGSVAPTDTLNQAVGKLEKNIEAVAGNVTAIPDATILAIINGTYDPS